jgi:ribonuclease HII
MAVSLAYELALWNAGAEVVVGIDEVGRGALAGPVTVGMVAVTRCSTWPEGLADSKQLTAPKRVAMADALAEFGAARAVGHASPAEIDAHGIVAALRLAGMRALAAIADAHVAVDTILLDGKHDWLTPPNDDLFAASAGVTGPALPPVTMVIGGDNLCASIAAGSVLAKVERDALMREAHVTHPEYGWDGNKGYGAEGHLDALRRLGTTPLHRRSWKLPEHVSP